MGGAPSRSENEQTIYHFLSIKSCFKGEKCSGRNYHGRRCCTPDNPCDIGEGDCDGPRDGGQHDGHAGCRGDLVCGSNNCLKFGTYYHEKDDCCEKPPVNTTNAKTTTPRKRPSFNPNLPTFFRPLGNLNILKAEQILIIGQHCAARGGRLTRAGAAPRPSPARRARATVTGTRSARAAWSAGITTADR